jgi:hypothetical protein
MENVISINAPNILTVGIMVAVAGIVYMTILRVVAKRA